MISLPFAQTLHDKETADLQCFFAEKQTNMPPQLLQSWVGCFGFNGPLRQYFSLYRTVSQREKERRNDT